MKEVLESTEFFIEVNEAGQEKRIIKELIGKINEKLTDNKIPEDGEVDDSNMLERVNINDTHSIRMWNISPTTGGLNFRASLFAKENA